MAALTAQASMFPNKREPRNLGVVELGTLPFLDRVATFALGPVPPLVRVLQAMATHASPRRIAVAPSDMT